MAKVPIREVRRQRLLELLDRHGGQKIALAKALGKSPAQVSQWCNHFRTISEDSAREIEQALKLPPGWMDTLPAHLGTAEPTGPAYRTWPFSVEFERYERISPAMKEMLDQAVRAAVLAWEADNRPASPSEKRPLRA